MKNILLIFMVFALIACSKSPQDNYNEAVELIKNKNYPEAISKLEELINKNDKELSPKALIELATLYHNKTLTDLSETESAEKAQYYFYTVYERYPEYPDAPKSLFMSAFILANELNKYDDATKLYNLFIEKYPNHELVSSAKEELEFIGLSPEEILQKKISRK